MIHESQTISVGMPVFNGESHLEDAIRSLLSQTNDDFTLYISDNASTDRTQEICLDFAKTDQRVIYARNQTNVGAAKNYSLVYHRASAKYFRWFNADDVCEPTLHERCLAILDAHPDVVMTYGNSLLIDGEGKTIGWYQDSLDLRDDDAADRFIQYLDNVGLTNEIYGLIRKSALEHTSLMGDGSYPAADVVLMAELALNGQFWRIDETLFRRRMHDKSISQYRGDVELETAFWRGQSGSFALPTWKKHAAFLRAVARSPLTVSERFRAAGHVLRRLNWSKNDLVAEARDSISTSRREHA